MFYNCNNLINLNLSKFNLTNVSKVDGIFHGCHKKMIDSNKSLFKNFNDNDLIKEFIENIN
jgi:surface protein